MVERLQDELARVKVRNEQLEAEYTERKNYEQLLKEKEEFRLKTSELTRALNKLTKDCITKVDYEKLTFEFKEMKVIKSQLEVENDRLKAELISQQRSEIEN